MIAKREMHRQMAKRGRTRLSPRLSDASHPFFFRVRAERMSESVGHYKLVEKADRLYKGLGFTRTVQAFVVDTDYVAALAKYCREHGGRTVTYSHRTGGERGCRQHATTVNVQVPNSLSKPKKEESHWCAREPESKQVAAKKMLERLSKSEKPKETEKVGEALVLKQEDVKASTSSFVNLSAQPGGDVVFGAAQKSREQEQPVVANLSRVAPLGQLVKDDEQVIEFDLAEDFKRGAAAAKKAAKAKKKEEKDDAVVNQEEILEQTVVLQPWHHIKDMFFVGKDQHGARGLATYGASDCTLESKDYGEQYMLHIEAPRLAHAMAKTLSACERLLIVEFSTARDYTRSHSNKAIVFNVTVDEHRKPHGIVGHTSEGKATILITTHYRKDHEIDLLPVGTVISFSIKERSY